MEPKLEIVHFDTRPDRNGWRKVQLALDGKLCCPLDIQESRYREMTETEFLAHLRSQAAIAIRAFGDYRHIRRLDDGTYVQLEAGQI